MSLETRQAPAGSNAVLAAGFSDPVHDAQRCFRALMNAMAQPGKRQTYDASQLKPPVPLTPMGAALALTLFDYDTAIWLDPGLARSLDVLAFLRFHTSAPIVSTPVEASFAIVSDPAQMSALSNFNQGSADYPDRSTTVILLNQTFSTDEHVELSGPGLKEPESFSSTPVPNGFWRQVQANNAQYPRGVDLVFAGTDKIAALPRSTRISPKGA
ncbi:alpha-D-ribose 1-methylphosphonate 5-triphosphate synthase subunit PhnH [Roseibium hamelinense]|uniref:Alpha-D-ribose 1-methylphosphonate 5-triphosphate synthase subunit PhnH n=1 Tax=Roseibium hamelinense TaxID=150831 RepID=A0A562SKT5_9HYPH|nr:phosphonate C-P lyase system protein PhnH [Roseibium hamelinense]MTI43458.1 phosphonate C-P lyase system protein PhnH [Roseibium hamelinense]TWI81919.1 alpha-D-ribose 1-methylphosphonate 5-triphosphate synthase subunit PhnH [Roseibium hamelinense]